MVSVKGDHLLRLRYLKTGKEISHLVNIQKVKRAYGPWNRSIPSRIAKTDKKILSQKEELHDEPNYLSHTTGDEAEEKGKASGGETESWETTGQPSMTKVSTVNPIDPNPAVAARVVFPQSGCSRPEKQLFFHIFPHFCKIEPFKKYLPHIYESNISN